MKYLLVTIGVDNFGKISFIQSLLLYFSIIIDYGFNITATRDIARSKTKEEISKIFVNTMMAKLILLLICTIFYTILIFTVPKFSANASLYFLFWGVVIGNCLFPIWYFQGIQKMGYITIVNAIIKVILLLSVFIFVQSPSETIRVPIIYSISFLVPGIYAFHLAYNKCIRNISPSLNNIKSAYKQGLPIFISSSISSILNGSTIFIMGFLVTDSIIGYYSGFDKLSRGILVLFTPITTAIYPHISSLIANDKKKGISYIRKYAEFTITLAAIIVITTSVFSRWIIPFLFTADFLQYSKLLYILLIWVIFSVANNFLGLQYLTCIGQSKLYAILMTICCTTALVMIFILTPIFSCYGTAISVLIGEALLTILMLTCIIIKKL